MSAFNTTSGLVRIVRAFRYSLQGLGACYRHEAAFRQEVLAALLIVPLGLWLGRDGGERALLVGSWCLVMVVELLNSAVEATVDRFGPDHHELSGRAKDIGSAAVLLTIVLAAVVWLLVLLPDHP
ncbi:MAG: diacylglycerol kinase [Chromatiaceae bacterium]|nr:diacylglycerol kinase [Gammaproteobacteria bacterium]MCP5304815.1 diacylglycerol kinase [Chromatiaceae bacterium]MCP5314774.1 diacylglycerol kinase [Chromatiaceae bacterium]